MTLPTLLAGIDTIPNVRAALRTQLLRLEQVQAALGPPTLGVPGRARIAMEAQDFQMPQDGFWVREKCSARPKQRRSMGPQCFIEYTGMYFLDVFGLMPEKGSGTRATADLARMAGIVEALFPAGLLLSYGGRATRVTSSGQGPALPPWQGWQQIPVTVSWTTEAQNTI